MSSLLHLLPGQHTKHAIYEIASVQQVAHHQVLLIKRDWKIGPHCGKKNSMCARTMRFFYFSNFVPLKSLYNQHYPSVTVLQMLK